MPRPEPTICTSVGSEVAAKAASSARPGAARGRRRPAHARAGSGRPPAGSGPRRPAARARPAPRRSAGGWRGRRPTARPRRRRPVSSPACRRAGRSAPRPARRPSGAAISRPVRSSRRNSRSLGKRRRSTGRALGSRNGAMVGITPRRKRPASGWPAPLAACTRSSAWARMVCARGHRLLADGGQDDAGAAAVDHRRAQDLLQLLHAGRQGRLGDVGGLGGAAERAVLGQQLEVLQLSEGREHCFPR